MRGDGLPALLFVLVVLAITAAAKDVNDSTPTGFNGTIGWQDLVDPAEQPSPHTHFNLTEKLMKLPGYAREEVHIETPKHPNISATPRKPDKILLKLSNKADPFVKLALENRVQDENVAARRRLRAQQKTNDGLQKEAGKEGDDDEDPCIAGWEMHTIFMKAKNMSHGGWFDPLSNPSLMPLSDLPIVGAIGDLVQRVTYTVYTHIFVLHCHTPEAAKELLDILQEVKSRTNASIVEFVSMDMPIVGNSGRISFGELPRDLEEGAAAAARHLQQSLHALSTNDPLEELQYALEYVRVRSVLGAPGAWERTTGYHKVVVGVIDTGLDVRHPDITDNLWINTGEIKDNGIDDDGNGFVDDYYGYDFVGEGDSYPEDGHGHGTHVAGIIGAVGNNFKGVTGVMQRVRIMPIKVLDSNGTGSIINIVRGIDYALMMGAHILCNSYGGQGFDSPSLMASVQKAQDNGVLFVAAAGNSATDNDVDPLFPASLPQDIVVSVAASNQQDELASFSNYGARSVDLAAPGKSIVSLQANTAGYTTMDGTSQATPVVVGSAALLMAAMEELRGHPFVGQGLFIKQLLMASVDRLPAFQGKMVSNGRLNVARAMDILLHPNTTIPAPGEFTPVFPATDGTGGLVNPSDKPASDPASMTNHPKPNGGHLATSAPALTTLLLSAAAVLWLAGSRW